MECPPSWAPLRGLPKKVGCPPSWALSPFVGPPISDIRAAAMISLVDDGELAITLEDVYAPQRNRWRFVFRKYPAYRNILEEYRLELWQHLDKTKQRCGNTFSVVESPWIASFRPHEPLLDIHYPKLVHFVIATGDDVIEILSPEAPRIDDLGATPADAPPPGKSTTLYYPKDKDLIMILNDPSYGIDTQTSASSSESASRSFTGTRSTAGK